MTDRCNLRVSAAALLLFAVCGCSEPEQSQSVPQANVSAPQPRLPAEKAQDPAGVLDRSHAGSAMPATIFTDPEGEPVTLDGSRGGKPLLLNLWATWCAPCVVEMPVLDALAGEEKRIEVVVVSQDLNGREKVDPFFREHGFANLLPYTDPDNGLSSDLKVTSLPTTIYYGADGKERWRIIGIEDWRGAKAAKLLAEGFAR